MKLKPGHKYYNKTNKKKTNKKHKNKSAVNKKLFTTEHQQPLLSLALSQSDPESSDAETTPNLVEGDIAIPEVKIGLLKSCS